MAQSVYKTIHKKKKERKKMFALLIDPDKFGKRNIVEIAVKNKIDFFLVGGSLLTSMNMESCIRELKKQSSIPVVIFPGSPLQVSNKADALLFLSLLSGRNPDYLIGHHVIAAPYVKAAKLEVIPTGYLLVDSGSRTTAAYISQTNPVPYDKTEIAVSTSIAGEMLGFKLIYLDAGSGAGKPVSAEMVNAVHENIQAPLIVGGGIRSKTEAKELLAAGADIIVVGNAAESNPEIIGEIAKTINA